MAMKLSRLIGTSTEYWLNLQNAYDALLAEFYSEMELQEERRILKSLQYTYFRDYFHLPDLPQKEDEQVVAVRDFLRVASLTVLSKYDLAASFRSASGEKLGGSQIPANAMVQITVNQALGMDAPKFNRHQLERVAEYALTLTETPEDLRKLLFNEFLKAGVLLIILPDHPGSEINGAAKKIVDKVLLMINGRWLQSDRFWFVLFHVIGQILNGDFGMFLEGRTISPGSDRADQYAADKLIPPDRYRAFLASHSCFTPEDIIRFAQEIHRNPGIVMGRLLDDHYIAANDESMRRMKIKYNVV